MKRLSMLALVAVALGELLLYDALLAMGGFARVRRSLSRPARRTASPDADYRRVVEAMDLACALYWKPVLCLQNAVVTARLLRRRGCGAEVVIGCRPEPFFSHAWVELDGRVVNDSPIYRQQLAAVARL